jgi:hypothetical protein
MCPWIRFAALASGVMITLMPLAYAQLPNVQLPQLPPLELPRTVTRTVDGVVEGVAGGPLGAQLPDLRRTRIRHLLRTRHDLVELDPAGELILRAEIAAISPTDDAIRRARSAGFEVARERVLEELGERVVVLRAPRDMSTRRALRRMREIDPGGPYDYNHVYTESGIVGEPAPAAAMPAVAGERPASIRVGLVDGGVDTSHPAFDGSVIHQHGCGDRGVPSAHGTAVASLLVGRAGSFGGAAGGGELFAADVYCGQAVGGAADAVVEAIAWVAKQRVPVINVSLVGPHNTLLARVVSVVVARGVVIVAAVGNDGPAAAPLYPASYPDVVGVTGVDARRKVLPEACRGKQVDFAAPGSDMAAAGLASAIAVVRGTSFAAPLVSSLLASSLHEPDPSQAAHSIEALGQSAADLGVRGRDSVYGRGLVGEALRIPPSAIKDSANK